MQLPEYLGLRNVASIAKDYCRPQLHTSRMNSPSQASSLWQDSKIFSTWARRAVESVHKTTQF